MSLLAPLYLIGGLAIALPILVHLIRRRPKAQAEFSSLMFLKESPPQLTKRSRLDDWPLLAMRALALLLLALAFSRPFWRSEQTRSSGLMGRRMVLLVDTSASMQRTGIPIAVQAEIEGFMDRLEAADTMAVIQFDEAPKIVVDFDQFESLDPAAVRDSVLGSLEQVKPGWRSTNLGSAIAFAVDHASQSVSDSVLQVDGEESLQSPKPSVDDNAPLHIVIVSDFQMGSATGSLQSYVWPDNVTAEFSLVVPSGTTNASVELLQQNRAVLSAGDEEGSESAGSDSQWNARVSNSADAAHAQFDLDWLHGSNGVRRNAASNIQVPPGQSRVVSVDAPLPGEELLVVSGDDHDFDNQHYVIAPTSVSQKLVHFGPVGLQPDVDAGYYLSRVPLDTQRRRVEFVKVDSGSSNAKVQLTAADVPLIPLVVLSAPLPSDQTNGLTEYIREGGHVLALLGHEDDFGPWNQSLKELSNVNLKLTNADVDDYSIWSEVDFRDPLFSVMADPQFSDFSNLRFWSHRKVTMEDPDIDLENEFEVVVRFDDGDPGLIRRKIGAGQLTIMTAGWQPAESQLALSTKFIPLVYQLFDPQTTEANAFQEKVELKTRPIQEWVDRWVKPETNSEASELGQRRSNANETQNEGSPSFTLRGTWGERSVLDVAGIDQPGILNLRSDNEDATVAVNLVSAESQTEPMDRSSLEALGVVFGKPLTSVERQAKQKQLRDVELESSQAWWRWILAGTLGILAVETVWGGRKRKMAMNPTTTSQPHQRESLGE